MANNMSSAASDKTNIRKIFLIILAVYLVLIVSFYFLAGDQLLYRESRGTLTMPEADAATAELSRETVVEQIFQAKIQRLQAGNGDA